MTFRITDENTRMAVAEYIMQQPVSRPLCVSISREETKRSISQNKLYWKWVGVIASETGNDADTIHRVLCRKFLGATVKEVLGERVYIVNGTHGLSKDEFTAFLNQVEAFSYSELLIRLPHPEDLIYDQL